jgi:hypothetical protein
MFAQTKTINASIQTKVMKYVHQNNLSKILSDIRRGLNKEEKALTEFERKQLNLQGWTLGAIALTFSCYVWIGCLQYQANGIYQHSADLTQKSIDLTQQSISLTQTSIKISQKSLMESHAPWVALRDVRVTEDKASGEDRATMLQNELSSPTEQGKKIFADELNARYLSIYYVMQNFSDAPSFKQTVEWSRVFADTGEAVLIKKSSYGTPQVIMPNQSIPCRCDSYRLSDDDVDPVLKGTMALKCTLTYWDVYKREYSFNIYFGYDKSDGLYKPYVTEATLPDDF